MDIAVDHRDWHPQLLASEEKLFLQGPGLVRREVHHAQLGAQIRRVLLPVEIGLRRVWLGKSLHLVKRFVVKLEGQIKGLGNGLIGDVIVAGQVRTGDDAVVNGTNLRRPDTATILLLETFFNAMHFLGNLPGDYKVIVGAETADSIDDVSLVVLDHFNLFQSLGKIRHLFAEKELVVFCRNIQVRVESTIWLDTPSLSIKV